MAQKKYRADNTYIISTDSTDNPKLGAKVLSDGRESLFLDFYLGYQMAISKNGKEYKRVNIKRSFLSLYLLESPKTQIERQQNKETLELAKKIRFITLIYKWGGVCFHIPPFFYINSSKGFVCHLAFN